MKRLITVAAIVVMLFSSHAQAAMRKKMREQQTARVTAEAVYKTEQAVTQGFQKLEKATTLEQIPDIIKNTEKKITAIEKEAEQSGYLDKAMFEVRLEEAEEKLEAPAKRAITKALKVIDAAVDKKKEDKKIFEATSWTGKMIEEYIKQEAAIVEFNKKIEAIAVKWGAQKRKEEIEKEEEKMEELLMEYHPEEEILEIEEPLTEAEKEKLKKQEEEKTKAALTRADEIIKELKKLETDADDEAKGRARQKKYTEFKKQFDNLDKEYLKQFSGLPETTEIGEMHDKLGRAFKDAHVSLEILKDFVKLKEY